MSEYVSLVLLPLDDLPITCALLAFFRALIIFNSSSSPVIQANLPFVSNLNCAFPTFTFALLFLLNGYPFVILISLDTPSLGLNVTKILASARFKLLGDILVGIETAKQTLLLPSTIN